MPFPKTLNLCSSLSVRAHLSHMLKKKNGSENILLCVLIYKFVSFQIGDEKVTGSDCKNSQNLIWP
jgi:hypothetical protein